jgi:hypothetical protein
VLRDTSEPEPVVDLRCWRAYLAWLERYRRVDAAVVPTAALQDAFKYAFFAGLFEGEGSR